MVARILHLVVVRIQAVVHTQVVAHIQVAVDHTLEVVHSRMGQVEVHSPVRMVVVHNHVAEEVRSLAQAVVGHSLNHSEQAGLAEADHDPDREGADHNTYLD